VCVCVFFFFFFFLSAKSASAPRRQSFALCIPPTHIQITPLRSQMGLTHFEPASALNENTTFNAKEWQPHHYLRSITPIGGFTMRIREKRI
jgi:hypothetical protein